MMKKNRITAPKPQAMQSKKDKVKTSTRRLRAIVVHHGDELQLGFADADDIADLTGHPIPQFPSVEGDVLAAAQVFDDDRAPMLANGATHPAVIIRVER